MGGIEALGVGFWVKACPSLLVGLGGTVRRTVVVPAAFLRPEEFFVQFLRRVEGSLSILAGVSPRKRYEFDLIAAGGTLEAIERAGLFSSAVIADDKAVDALAEGTRPPPLPGAPRLQSGDAQIRDDLIHVDGSLDLVEVNSIRVCLHVSLLYVTDNIILYDPVE